MHGDRHAEDGGAHGGLVSQLVQGWPRAFYRWNESRYLANRRPYAVFQAMNLAMLLTAFAAAGLVGAALAWLFGGPVENGFWAGVTVAGGVSMLAVVGLVSGGLLEWLAKRR